MTNTTRDDQWISDDNRGGMSGPYVYVQDGLSYRGYRVASDARAQDIVSRGPHKTAHDWCYSLEQE